ncbi:MAG: SusC/RagA family TonB-linked outer membrane protein [Niastella sp.]|nr:SusC/RagA family TonB-linked outer membrane protein [Niastella sp.]
MKQKRQFSFPFLSTGDRVRTTRTFLRLLLFIMVGSLMAIQVKAQTKVISGVIVDDKNNPVEGATVAPKNSTAGKSTDAKGSFSLTVPANTTTLVVSSVGYDTKEVALTNQTVLTITLTQSVTTLANVTVVNALGFETKKDRVGYASSRVGAEQLGTSGEAGLADALGGKASGVRVSRTSGDPGAASQILIRGQSTITRGTDPLIVLDGVPINGTSRNESNGGTTQQSRINDINPDDIASIQVLKGASAAALWGTRAANGVIVITTKKGGGQGNITFKTTYSIDEVSRFYDLQNTYGQGTNGAWQANNTRSWGDKIANRPGAADAVNTTGASFLGNDGKTYYPITAKNSRDVFLDQNYNAVIQKGHFLENSLSMSGGDSKSNYFFSVADLNQEGIFKQGSTYRRTGIRLNVTKELYKWLSVTNKASYSLINSDRMQTGVNNAGFMIGLLRTPPDFDNTAYVGKYAATAGGALIENRQRSYRNYLGASANPGFNNPLWDLYKLENTSKVNRFINSAEVNIKPVQWFNLTARAGVDYWTDRQINYAPYFSTNFNTGNYNRQEYTEMQFNLDVIARAEKEFSENFTGNLLVGFNYNALNTSTLGANSQNFVIPDGPQDLDNATPSNISTSDGFSKVRSNAGYGSIGFGLYDQLFVNATGRIEAASTFGAMSNNSFFYPSGDVAWQFSQLPAIQHVKFLTFGKLRASYGVVGIQPQAYQTATNFVVRTWSDGWGGALDPSLYGAGTYIQSVNKGNAYLKPEKKQEFELGTDLRFFDNKLSFSFTYYQNKTVDALINISQAASTGFDNLYANAGSIQNKGVEVDLSYNLVRKKDWDVSVNVNWTRNRNKVLDLSGAGSINLGGTAGISSRAVEGYALGILYSIPWVRDDKGNLKLDANGFPTPGVTSAPIGDPNPDWRGGIGFNIKYKNFTLSALIEHSQGGVVANGTEAVLVDYGTSAATGNEVTAPGALKRYNGTTIAAGTVFRGNIHNFGAGDVALDQSWYTGPGGFFGNVGELFLEDATWTRFRELNIGYTINAAKLRSKLGVKSIMIELSGRNLFLISDVKGYDPDSNVSGSTSGRGVVYFVNPPTRSYIASLKLTF